MSRVERIWKREGLKVPQKQPKRGRLWLNDGSCIRLRPCWPRHVWSYDFVQDRTHDGRSFRILTVILASNSRPASERFCAKMFLSLSDGPHWETGTMILCHFSSFFRSFMMRDGMLNRALWVSLDPNA